MKPKQLQAIRERVNKATPGPWKWEPGEHLALGRIAGEYTICQFGGGRHWDEWKGVEPDEEDAEFITHAREDVPALLDYADNLIKENERLRAALGRYAKGEFANDYSRMDYAKHILSGGESE